MALTNKQIANDIKTATVPSNKAGGIAKIIGWNESALNKTVSNRKGKSNYKGLQPAFRFSNNALRPDTKK